ncbi:MAG: SAM-dependent methyltransferase [Bdellovibrio sp.]|nr:MAG: SAM-dependent methyltransferase [Bdellovibrio sp.]
MDEAKRRTAMDENYWDKIYQAKSEKEVSWFQEVPMLSLELISEMNLSLDDNIIDIGGGDSRLVDHLLDKGHKNLTVVDISAAALEKTRSRLGERSKDITFIVSDVTKFNPKESYKLWHDRATFHFLTSINDVEAYLNVANKAVAPGGYLIVSTFSKTGPEKCSGLTISKYSDRDLKALFARYFSNIRCFEDTHKTPWGSNQDFVYCGFKKR